RRRPGATWEIAPARTPARPPPWPPPRPAPWNGGCSRSPPWRSRSSPPARRPTARCRSSRAATPSPLCARWCLPPACQCSYCVCGGSPPRREGYTKRDAHLVGCAIEIGERFGRPGEHLFHVGIVHAAQEPQKHLSIFGVEGDCNFHGRVPVVVTTRRSAAAVASFSSADSAALDRSGNRLSTASSSDCSFVPVVIMHVIAVVTGVESNMLSRLSSYHC